MTPYPTNEVTLAQFTPRLRDSDLLLFRGTGLVSRLIGVAGRSRYTHAAKACVLRGIPCVAEVREWYGGRIVTLESQVALYPGRIDVYRTNHGNFPGYDPRAAITHMLRFAGRPYGWGHVFLVSLLHTPVLRLFRSVDDDDRSASPESHWPPFCSGAVAASDRVGGCDPVPNLADYETEPGDLARSSFYRYLATLIPEPRPEGAIA